MVEAVYEVEDDSAVTELGDLVSLFAEPPNVGSQRLTILLDDFRQLDLRAALVAGGLVVTDELVTYLSLG